MFKAAFTFIPAVRRLMVTRRSRPSLPRLLAVFALVIAMSAHDAAAGSFPGEKSLESGPDPVGIKRPTTSVFTYSISLTPPIPTGTSVVDRVPAELDVYSLCSDGTFGELCEADADCDIPGECIFTDLCVAGDVGSTCTADADCTLDGICDFV